MGPVSVKIDQLQLDTLNQRTGQTGNQIEAFQKIIDDQKAKLAVLAEDIVNEGLSPMDNILVVKDKGEKYIVVEGNRRTAALKILLNPNILGGLNISSPLRTRLEKAAKNFSADDYKKITVSCVDNREEAKKWVHLKHTGENGGRGTVPWSGMARAQFRGSDPALQALDFVKRAGNLTPAEQELVDDRFPITTLRRLFTSPDTRKLIGIEIKDGKLRTGFPSAEIIKPLKKIVLDLAGGDITVTDLKLKDQQVTYLENLPKTHHVSQSKKGNVANIDELTAAPPPVTPPKAPRKRTANNLATRKKLVPSGLRLNITNKKVQSIFNELKGLEVEDNKNSCAVLLRVFLELSVDHYCQKNRISTSVMKNGHKTHFKLGDKVKNVVTDIVAKNTNLDAKDFTDISRAIKDQNSPLHLDLLHGYVHNLFVVPKAKNLRDGWDEAQLLFEEIWM